MPTSDNGRPKRKERRVNVPMDDELYNATVEKAQKNGVSVAAWIRSLVRWGNDNAREEWTPDGLEAEKRRAPKQPRKKKKGE